MFNQVNRTQVVDGQHAAALAFGHRYGIALFQALCLFILLPEEFPNKTQRRHVAELMGETPKRYAPGRMNNGMRRLRLDT